MPQINLNDLQSSMGRSEPLSGEVFGPKETLPTFKQDPCRTREEPVEEVKSLLSQANPLTKLNPKRLNTRWQVLEQLNATIPLNDYNLPTFIYRADLLHQDDFKCLVDGDAAEHRLLTDKVNTAMVPLDYHQGYPTLPSALPLWHRLDFEPIEANQAFIAYLELGATRQLHEMNGYDLDVVREFFHLYYWHWRVQSFDLYKVAAHTRKKLHRMLQVEDDHYTMAETYLQKVKDALNTEEAFTGMTAAQLVKMMAELVKIQRVSVGLTANGAQNEGQTTPKAQSMELILQQVSTGAAPTKTEKTEEIDYISSDPASLEAAQKLIVRMQTGK